MKDPKVVGAAAEDEKPELAVEDVQHPMHQSSYVNNLFFIWLQPIIKLGYKRPLEVSDLPELSTKWRSKALYKDFQPFWQAQVEGGNPSLLKALYHRFKGQYFYGASYLLWYAACAVTLPLTIRGLLQYVNAPEEFKENPYWGLDEGYYLVILLGVFSVAQTVTLNKGFGVVTVMGCKLRSTVMCAIYNKSLRLSPAARRSKSSAENLMSADAERIFMSLLTSNILYIGFLLVIAVAVLLVVEIGISGLIGVLFTFVIAPVQTRMARSIGIMKRKMLEYTDQRVKFTGEVLNGINVVKISSWEAQMEKRINDFRRQEMKLDRSILYLMAINAWILFVVPSIIACLVFAIYVALGNRLSVETVFTVLVYLGIIRIPIAVLPRAASDIAQALVSLKRIQDFLLLPELEEDNAFVLEPVEGKKIVMKDATYQWSVMDSETIENPTKKSTCLTLSCCTSTNSAQVEDPKLAAKIGEVTSSIALRNINFDVNVGELVGVVGKVGSGKSSLISAIINDIDQIGGKSFINTGPIAYVAQEPWIQNATLQNNILFKSELFSDASVERTVDDHIFRVAMQAAQLGPDAKVLPSGIHTEIGDRGVNLSGGQKSRVTIARAVYRALRYNLDVAIFDDPFSALDPHVGQVVFEEVLLNRLKDKTRVVVLNSHLHLLEKMDRVAVLEDGKVVAFDEPSAVLNDPRFLWLGQNASDSKKAVEKEEKKLQEPSMEEVLEDVEAPSERVASSHMSVETRKALEKTKVEENQDGVLYSKEDRKLGAVERSNYVRWVGAGVGTGYEKYVVITLLLLTFIVSQGMKIGQEYFLGYWSQDQDSFSFGSAMGIYVALVFGLCTTQLAGTLGFMKIAISSALNLHNQLTKSVLRAPLNLFFDVTPAGRILNRFSTDLDKVDQRLPDTCLNFTRNVFQVLATVILCLSATPWFLAILVPLFLVFGFVVVYFARTSREVKRLEGISRTPLFSNFGESLQGLTTIRAFGMGDYFIAKSNHLVDRNSKVFLIFWQAARWLALRVDLLATVIQIAVGCFAVFSEGSIPPEVVGLTLLYSLQMMGMLQFTVRLSIETENYMTSVERLLAYGSDNIPQEASVRHNDAIRDAKLSNNLEDKLIPSTDGTLALEPKTLANLESSWPTQGAISIHNISMRYRPHLPLVLKNVSMEIEAKTRVAVVGRTGSGKSSFMSLFFRLVDPPETGYIAIDGTPISSVPLHLLRSKLAIIPQAPTIFSGSVRFNIDPWGTCTDADIWSALERVQLANEFRTQKSEDSQSYGLDTMLDENGSNLSVGQRQLLCIARALLKDAKVVLMDEATANVDRATDRLIQDAMQSNFQNQTTTLVIAHRINTIIDADKIAVLDYGVLKEFGAPEVLVREGGIFAGMVEASGLTSKLVGE